MKGQPDMPTGLKEHLLADFKLTGNAEGEIDWVINPDDVVDADYKQ